MNKAELRQKLEAVRDELAVRPKAGHEGTTRYYSEEVREGFDTLLPLLLDAYEALDKVEAGAVCRVITPKEEHGQILDNCLKISAEILARIEAFATQGAHEQSEFENGEK